MDLAEMLVNYVAHKKSVSRSYWTLREACEQESVFRRPTHASSYAAVTFACRPAAELWFTPAAAWPPAVSDVERERMEAAIACGIVAGLLDATLSPLRVCHLTLVRVGWDEVGSSQEAFYQAAKSAMTGLLHSGRWQLIS